MHIFQNILHCPSIISLSINDCHLLQCLQLCACTPNLIKLKIRNVLENSHNSLHSSLTTHISQTTRLVELHIIPDRGNSMNINFIKDIINCYKSSLEQLTFNIHSYRRIIDGELLQTLIQPCQHLNKLAFVFQYQDTEDNVIKQIQQFQSTWWLDNRRPPVLILRNNDGCILLSSMPFDEHKTSRGNVAQREVFTS
ncbi:unnamed protein product [Rotaria sp. Silwood2]|nr:unnamed protein product [Rotaria sp. Silwood2]CAF3372850.1 unnamed protein product [Rotaria sp. Silwood2]CAF4309591.1 unnamed protein product [Rotaria sp. Silwood2]CAF4490896.1 unnamed protein product [Rotaria sp. Silwood2]